MRTDNFPPFVYHFVHSQKEVFKINWGCILLFLFNFSKTSRSMRKFSPLYNMKCFMKGDKKIFRFPRFRVPKLLIFLCPHCRYIHLNSWKLSWGYLLLPICGMSREKDTLKDIHCKILLGRYGKITRFILHFIFYLAI